ncbi:hypothetical protein GOBAR_DD06952 [Gossypium barbadense]|nr:hypothetical protein GOBAR_DD06952 [Gossypium barbadense]
MVLLVAITNGNLHSPRSSCAGHGSGLMFTLLSVETHSLELPRLSNKRDSTPKTLSWGASQLLCYPTNSRKPLLYYNRIIFLNASELFCTMFTNGLNNSLCDTDTIETEGTGSTNGAASTVLKVSSNLINLSCCLWDEVGVAPMYLLNHYTMA